MTRISTASAAARTRARHLRLTTALCTILTAAGLAMGPPALADGCVGNTCTVAAGDTVQGVVLDTVGDITAEIDGTSTAAVSLTSSGPAVGEAEPGVSGGTITFNASGTVTSAGSTAVSLVAQGSAGGDGAADGTLINAEPDPGGTGGSGGFINANITGNIAATGDNASAVTAYSGGGDGGTGGDANSAFGGGGADGGAGGAGSTVDVRIAGGTISTTGDNAFGVDAESFGGAGGNGGNRDGIGGDAGDGGPASGGGTVNIALTGGTITTSGQNAHGVLAQSIGGTGGNGGSGTGLFNGSGNGLAGADANTVAVSGAYQAPGSTPIAVLGTDITTTGDKSDAILAQSLGGGGGNGGDVTDVDVGFGVVIGGSGGAAGDGEEVDVTSWGSLSTGTQPGSAGSTGGSGYLSDGILAQSIGGGGGNGGDAYDFDIGLFSLAIGGSSGGGGNAGAVNVTNNGGIVTQGDHAAGVLAQSIGGGGGKGGSATSIDADVGLSVSVAIGADGGTGGAGGAVAVTNNKGILTTGADSFGVQAQSIGGGGGKGGTSLARSYAISPTDPPAPAGAVSVGIGGSGGGGNGAAKVAVTNAGSIATLGAGAIGIVAQSIGGGGGSGGSSKTTAEAASLDFSIDASVSLGGTGGSGGDAGEVDVTNNGLVLTLGHDADAVFAQSIGGGGGLSAMGDSDAAGLIPLTKGFSATVTLGGSGGGGGSANTVNVTNNSGLLTYGSGAHGVFAHSVGGGGGRGTGGSADSDGDNFAIAVGVGGAGGSGNDGGTVNVTNNASILTMGSDSAAIVAQSVGGGGGWGGKVKAETKASPTFGLFSLEVGKLTSGGSASGSLAQSAEAGLSSQNDVGDLMKTGNDLAGEMKGDAPVPEDNEWKDLTPFFSDVDLDDDGANEAVKDAAGKDVADAGDLDPAKDLDDTTTAGGSGGEEGEVEGAFSISTSVGGKGGSAGDGGDVNVTTTASLVTLGDHSTGIFAQSVGGGGGHGGASSSSTSTGQISASIGVGGSGGASGDGGDVTVKSGGSLFTFGNHSHGILGQSVGGGGGTGGAAGETTGALLLNVGVSVGGSGGASGAGGKVAIDHDSGSIATFGDFAVGILAQSVGGGGGLASLVGAGSIPAAQGGNATGGSTPISADGFDLSLPPLDLSFNGSGGTSGSADTVAVTSAGDIATYGHGAHGILAQSIGGGGGAILGGAGQKYPVLTTSDGATGDGAAVTVEVGGLLRTVGDGAAGVIAQSIGGGGGLIGDLFATDLTYSLAPNMDGQDGSGGAVSVTVDAGAEILTLGAHSYGVIAQSVGNGGGLAASSSAGFNYLRPATAGGGQINGQFTGTGSAGPITLALNGTVAAIGDRSWAVYAQSSGPSAGAIDVTIADGVTVAGGSSGGGIYLSQGATAARTTNTVTNGGTITTADGTAGTAIVADSGNITVSNTGTIIGSIELGTGQGQLTNSGTIQAGSSISLGGQGQITNSGTLYASGTTISLGSQGQFTNNGTVYSGPSIDLGGHQPLSDQDPTGAYVFSNNVNLYIGGDGTIATTALNGDYTDEEEGTLWVDVDFAANKADLLQVSGNAFLEGANSLAITPLSLQAQWVTILTAGQLSADPSFILANQNPTLLFGFEAQQSGNDLQVMPTANFTAYNGSLTSAEQAVATHLQAAWNSNQSSDLGEGFVQLYSLEGVSQYASTLDSLSAQTTNAVGNTQQTSSQNFAANMNSCPTFEGEGTVLRERDCAWGRLISGGASLDSNGGTLGYDLRTTTIQFGGQKEVAPDWFLGGSIAYENADLDDDAGAGSLQGDSVLVGVLAKRQLGNWLVSGGLSAGYGWYDSSRAIVTGDRASFVTGNPEAQHAGLHSRISYQAPFDGWYLKPYVDLHAVYTRTSSYTESGSSSLRLDVDAEDELRFSAAPMLELGGRVDAGDGRGLRPYLSVGAEFYDDRDWGANARFAGAPQDAGQFQAESRLPEQVAKLNLGVDLTASEQVSIKLEYAGAFGDDYQSHAGTLRFSYLFR